MILKKQLKLARNFLAGHTITSDIIKVFVFLFVLFPVIFVSFPTNTTINLCTLVPANPTNLSNGLGYYLAGRSYNFAVHVIDPDATAWTSITSVRLVLTGMADVQITPTATGAQTVTINSGAVIAACNIPGTDTYNNFTATFSITFRWDAADLAWGASRVITATATTSVPASNSMTATQNVSYGVCASVRTFNFSQDGIAADSYVNQYNSTFNVTGLLVYNVAGVSATDLVETYDPGEITNAYLQIDGADINTAVYFDNTPAAISYAIAAGYFATPGMGAHTWSIRTDMSTNLASEVSSGTLAITCDEVQINEVEIIGGSGNELSTSAAGDREYYRGTNFSGTQLRVVAQMRNSGANLIGNTTVTVYDGTNTYSVVISNNTTTASAVISPIPTVTAGDTTSFTYRVTAISGGVTDDEQNTNLRIRQPGNGSGGYTIVNWDNQDPPGANSYPFTAGITSPTQTASSITIAWTALTNAFPDQDFYTWRIYYRITGSTAWTMVDRNTSTNYGSGGAMGDLTLITTSSATIDGLAPLSSYDFKLSAVDYMGNEVPVAYQLGDDSTALIPLITLASSITVNITDGITTYDDNSFTLDATAAARPLRNNAIRIKFYIITGGNIPEQVNIIAAADDASGTMVPVPIASTATNWCRISCYKSAPNTYTGYIPTTNPLIVMGSNVRFILETYFNGAAGYSDHDAETEAAPGDPNNYEWKFTISNQPTFTPWPVRILNNVIDKSNPIAYPAYYLSDDAYVTITIYDIKGRPVTTLLEKTFRKGGQNIKENGWNGRNKSLKMCGDGLYYIHIEAKRASDKKIIISETRKVIIKR